MCRIAGIFDPNSNTLHEDILKMRDAMYRGGPDDAGLYINGAIALAHRRLSLLDLSADGHQPMLSADERYILVYNGEVYNFVEIREQLEVLGYTFKSKSDTEVVLYGFIHWGNALFEKLNGMFALAIYDKQLKRITIARDYAGIKPLYYFIKESTLYFASEIRAFNSLNRFEENPDWKTFFLAFGHLPEPVTTLKNVKQLPKGAILTYDLAMVNCTLSYFNNFQFTNEIQNVEEAIRHVRDKLTEAVKRHLISDAPIGLFLSGGIDSSLLTILAEPFLKNNLQTLSIDFDESEFSEKKFQDIIIAQTGAKHRTFIVTREQFFQALPDLMEAMDQPSTDGINSYFICKYAKEAGLTAVLSGLGADELFGGYNSFASMAKYELVRKIIPSKFFRIAQFFRMDKYQKASFLSIPGPIGQYLFNRGLLCPKEISNILNIPESGIWVLLRNLNQYYFYGANYSNHTNKGSVTSLEDKISIKSLFSNLDSFNKATYIESNLYMQNQLLKDSDYMSMWHSVEIRVPFLDIELIKLAYRISPKIKFFQKKKKYILIYALGSKLPKEIWDRPKMGFTFPFQRWLSNDLESMMHIANSKEQKPEYRNILNVSEQKKFAKGEYSWSRYWAIILMRLKS